MKIWTTLLTTALLIFSAGSSISAPATPGMGIGASSSLMKALTSSQAEMLSRGGQNVSVIFVQPRDGESTVRNVEALDTLYLMTRQTIRDGTIGLILIFETDKTNKALRLIRYRQQEGWWIGAVPYNPADLPDIDFQKAYRLVKAQAGDYPITQIGILHASDFGSPLIVVFSVKDEELPEGWCQEWVYTYDTGTVAPGLIAGCYFDMDNLGAITPTAGHLE